MALEGRYDFDHPSAIDSKLLINHLSRLKEGKSIQVPEYDFSTHSRVAKTVSFKFKPLEYYIEVVLRITNSIAPNILVLTFLQILLSSELSTVLMW